MKSRRRTVKAIIASAILLLAGFVLPPFINANRFRGRIAQAMEQALGRKVVVGEVTLRLLPQPGFALRNLVISDDPTFGAEPMLRADEVTAALRLASLWRGRLEIARLTLDAGADISPPSLNLVRATNGDWNLAGPLKRASEVPSAPTGQTHAEARPRFPYIEANGGRINIKIGSEKKPYALTQADFALWLASENEWRFRLSARPWRSDVDLSDSGTVKLNGRFRRAAKLADTPLEVQFALQRAPLGQLTKLIYGRDRGWRGAVEATAVLTGTPADLTINAQAGISDFRRYDIGTLASIRLDTRCDARYSVLSQRLSQLACQLPMGTGKILASGEIEGLLSPRAFNVSLAADGFPLQALVSLARHAKKDIPEDLAATGVLNAAFAVRKPAGASTALWSGGGQTSESILRSAVLGPDLPLPSLQMTIQESGAELHQNNGKRPTRTELRLRSRSKHHDATPEWKLSLLPFGLNIGGSAPATAQGWFSATRYDLNLDGPTRILRLLQLGRAIGLRVPEIFPAGSADASLQLAGQWKGLAAPTVTGSAQLHQVNQKLNGFAAPLQLTSADVALSPAEITVQNIAASFSHVPMKVTGSIRQRRGCNPSPGTIDLTGTDSENCPVEFDLRADQVSTDALNRLLNPRLQNRRWYDILGNSEPPSLLRRVQATGRFTTNKLLLKTLVATRVSADVQLSGGKLLLKALSAHVLGGTHQGEWQADFTGPQPVYRGIGTLQDLAAAQLAALLRDNGTAGGITANYETNLNGWTAAELLASATGRIAFEWRDGLLRHVTLQPSSRLDGLLATDGEARNNLAMSSPLQFRHFGGQFELREGTLTLAQSKIEGASGIYQVSGTASLTGQINLKLENHKSAYSVSGALTNPEVVRIETPPTRVAAKPQ